MIPIDELKKYEILAELDPAELKFLSTISQPLPALIAENPPMALPSLSQSLPVFFLQKRKSPAEHLGNIAHNLGPHRHVSLHQT